MTPLYNHTNQETAYVTNNYPYGRLKCNIRFWLESHPKKGFRFVSQTQNPKNNVWNNPRTGTYMLLGACLYIDDNNHVQCAGLSEYSSAKEILGFVEKFPKADFSILKVFIAGKKGLCKARIAGRPIFSIGGVPQNPSDNEIEEAKIDLDILDIASQLVLNKGV